MSGFFFGIKLPVDKDGNGPVSGDEIEDYLYEVWDQTFLTVLTGFSSLEDAQEVAEELNTYWEKIDGP